MDLVATAGVLELARVESRSPTEEVVNLTRLDVVGEARDEERVDAVSVVQIVEWRWLLVVEVVGIVRRMSHRLGLIDAVDRVAGAGAGAGGGGFFRDGFQFMSCSGKES